jgi:hypothetical protein
MAHLIDDKTVAKMGHPIVVVLSDVGQSAVENPEFLGAHPADQTHPKPL